MAEKFTNLASTTLATTINSSATSIVVADGSKFPSAGKFRITIEDEIIECSARSGNTITASLRGAESTTAASHTSGVDVEHSLTAGSLRDFRDEATQVGAYSGLPAASEKNLYLPTDGTAMAKGDGSAQKYFGPVYPFTTWDQTGFSWVNQGSATLTQRGSAWVLKKNPSSGDSLACYMKNCSNGQVLTVAVNGCVKNSIPMAFGIATRDASGGRLTTFGPVNDHKVLRTYWTTTTSFNSAESGNNLFPYASLIWLRMTMGSTSMTASISTNGYDFYDHATYNFADWQTPTQWGVFLQLNDSSGTPTGQYITIHSLSIT